MLCSAEPKALTGRITYSQDLLAELRHGDGTARPGDDAGLGTPDQMRGTSAAPPAGWVRVDCHLHTVASGMPC